MNVLASGKMRRNTETNISVAVEEAALANAVRAVHAALLEN